MKRVILLAWVALRWGKEPVMVAQGYLTTQRIAYFRSQGLGVVVLGDVPPASGPETGAAVMKRATLALA